MNGNDQSNVYENSGITVSRIQSPSSVPTPQNQPQEIIELDGYVLTPITRPDSDEYDYVMPTSPQYQPLQINDYDDVVSPTVAQPSTPQRRSNVDDDDYLIVLP